MAKKHNDGYLSAKESRRISKENRKITNELEKKRKRKNVPESEYLTEMHDPNNAVEFDNLHTYFFTDTGVVKSVDGVTFSVPIGKTVGVVGESGCGKSVTSLSLMQLLQRPQGPGVEGEVFKTKTEEISIRAKIVTLLSKSLLPLPNKFHGLTDKEARFRQRYVDLMVNPEVKRNFVIRSKFIKHLRNYLDSMGYIEVETPVLNTIAGGAAARPFVTHHNTLDIDMYMRIATELPLKRLIVGGMDRVYEVGRIFRNEGMDPKHNPEFTTVELYQAYADFHDMMDIAEGVYTTFAKEVMGSYELEWMGEKIDLTPGWPRLTMVEAVKKYVGVDFGVITDDAEAVAAAKAVGVELADAAEKTWGNALYACFDQKVEEHLVQPTFITMYPVEVSPLTKKSPEDPRLTERFEFFINRSEMGNAYSELNDPIDQRERFMKQVEQRERGDDETEMLDEDFLTALEYGMPPTGGMGMGIDRAVMLFTGADTIREVILFPTMKPQD